MVVVDISDLSKPALNAVVQGAGTPYYLDNIHDIIVKGDYAYVVSFNDSALSIFEISEKSDGASTKETTVETAQNGNVSILRQWLRENNPYSI
jgi:hypothetical protein